MLKLFKKDSQLEDKDHSLIGKIGENNEWEEIKTPSTVIARRSCHSSCIYKNKLYVYGGYDCDSTGIFKDLFSFSFENRQWEEVHQKGELPGPRHSHSMVAYKDKMYLFGGMNNFMNNTNLLHAFDFKTSTWTQIKSQFSPRPLDSHRSCLYGNKMVITLGYLQSDYNSNIYALNLDTLCWQILFDSKKSKGQYPSPRAQGTCCLYEDKLIIYGGRDGQTTFGDLWSFDLRTAAFCKIEISGNLQARFGHCAVVNEGKMLVFGGTKGVTHERNDLISIDLISKVAKTCWFDSQQERKKTREDSTCLVKKSRRDSAKKGMNWFPGLDEKEESLVSGNQSPGKYRTQLKEVSYYNSLYDRQQRETLGQKKTRKNPLLKELNKSGQQKQCLNMTATFQILTNSILLTQGKGFSKEEKNDFFNEPWKKVPKARDNATAEIIYKEESAQMIIFGGGMHKIGFNDLLKIDLKAISQKYLGELEQ